MSDKFFVNRSPSKETPKVHRSTDRRAPFCSFASSFIVSLTPFNSIPESSSDLTIFKMPFTSSFEIIKVLVQDPRIFLFIAASVADAAGVSPSTHRGLITDFNKGNPDFNNDAKNLKNPPICKLVNCAFDNLISVDVWLAKALRRFTTYLFVNNNF